MPTSTHRSIIEGCNNTVGSGSTPTLIPKVASRAHAHNNALARAGRTGATAASVATVARANAPAAAGIDVGRYPVITTPTSPVIPYIYDRTLHHGWTLDAKVDLDMRLDPEQRAQARRIATELAAIARSGNVAPGTITERRMRCGKANCRCHADPPQLHGPYWSWTRKVRTKTVGRWLTPEQRDDYATFFDNSKRLRALLAELEALGLSIIDADPRWDR